MKRLPLAALMAAFFVFLLWSVAVRQALLFLIGIGVITLFSAIFRKR